MEDPRRAFEALVEGLRGRCGEPTFEARLDDMLLLARAGEGGVAVDTLCSNLYEFDVPLAVAEHSALVELSGRWGFADSTAGELERLQP